MTFIDEYIKSLKYEHNLSVAEVANKLGISKGMVSQYSNPDYGYKASLEVAITVYKDDGIVLHPFAKESIQHEIKKEVNNRN